MNTHSARKHRWLLIAAAAAAVALVGCGSVTDTPASSRNTTPAQTSEPTAGRPPQQKRSLKQFERRRHRFLRVLCAGPDRGHVSGCPPV